jgi:hypothetical protein
MVFVILSIAAAGCLICILLRNWIVGSHRTESMKTTMKLAKALTPYTSGTHYLHLQTVGLAQPNKDHKAVLGFWLQGANWLDGSVRHGILSPKRRKGLKYSDR